MNVRTVHALTLDLDDTLWPVAPALEAADAAVDAWLRTHHPAVAAAWPVPALRALRERVNAGHPELAHDFTAQRQLTYRAAFAACGLPDAPVEPVWEIYFAARNRVTPFADSLAALARLAACVPLASLSNGNADLVRVGIDGHFRHCIAARDVGCAKPDPRIFHHAAASLGVAPAAVLHVGDDPELDVAGARRAGLAAAWINRTGAPWPAALGPRPALEFPDLGALANWLERGDAA